MTLSAFLGLVEIRTKVASLFPLLLGTLYAVYRFGRFSPVCFALMLASSLCFDMATTAINNYIDYKTAREKQGFGYRAHNAIVAKKIPPGLALGVIFLLLAAATALGLLLALQTGVIVLLCGMLAFGIGILYTFGPVPISRTPFGELFSGVTMGLGITFLASYIHIADLDIYRLSVQDGVLAVSVWWRELLWLLLFSLPSVCGIANIMLANNICDREEDLVNRRHTLVQYIGERAALRLFAGVYALGFAGIVLLAAFGVLPAWFLLALGCVPLIWRNVRTFSQNPKKGVTFVLSVQNFVLLHTLLSALMLVAVALPG